MESRIGVLVALFSLMGVQAARGQGGTFPPDPFNGMQTTYSVSGADVKTSQDHPGFTWERTIKGTLTPGTLEVSGSAKMGSGFYAQVTVTVSAGGRSKNWSARIPSGSPGFNSESFDVSVPVPTGATGGSFTIDMVGVYNVGTRGVVVGGTFDAPAGGIPPTVMGSPPPGLGNVGQVPGPEDLSQSGVGILLPGLLAAVGVGIKAMLDSSATPPAVVDYGVAGSTAPAPPPQSAAPASDYGPAYTQAIQEWQDAHDKYASMQQQLSDFEKGADKTDPHYENLKKQYTEYLDYYKQKADDSAANADAIAQAVDKDRNTKILKDYWGNDVAVVHDPATGEWHYAETGSPFDLDSWQHAQDQTAKDAAWGHADLDKMSAHQDSFSQSLDAIKKDATEKAKVLDKLGAIEKSVFFDGAASSLFQPPGTPGNILDNIDKLALDIASGKDIDKDKLSAITKLYRDSATGQILAPDQLPQPGDSDKGVWSEGVKSTLMDVATCTNEKGFSWKGMLVRTGLGIVTLGFSEVPMALGAIKQYVDEGGSSVVGGFLKGVEAVVVGEGMGAGLGTLAKGVATGGRVLGEAVGEVAGELGGVVKTAAEAGSSIAKGVVKAASVASEGATSLYNGIVKPVTGAVKSAADVLTTEIKLPGSGVAAETTGELAGKASQAEGAASAAAKTEGEAGAAAKAEAAAAPPTGKQNYTYANSPGEDVTPYMAGMPEGNISQAQVIADKYNAQILVRPTNPEAAELLASGEGIPKPCSIKNKTINDLDLDLGAKSENLGKVGHFDPKLPPKGSMTDEEYAELTNRYNQRREEFIKQNTVLENNPNVEIKDGVVCDKQTGRPFTGDHDIYDIVGADGKPLPPDVKAQIVKELGQPPFAAQHGAHMDWTYGNLSQDVPAGSPKGTISDFQQAQTIDTKIMNSHTVGGEPLISFGPNRPPQAAYFVGRR